ncbi:MAG: type III secretion system stalk subunit SctO, partial [Geminicoccaceae bacterium]
LRKLLACRRERESRAAAALRRARAHHADLRAKTGEAIAHFRSHERERLDRQRHLYRRSLCSRMTAHEIDNLNVALDLMVEETESLAKKVQDARAEMAAAFAAMEAAAAVYRQHRKAGDRWEHLVDDVARTERRLRAQAEEFAVEDDLGDRRSMPNDGVR